MATPDQVSRFAELYRGFDKARGIWWPRNGLMETARDCPQENHFKDHLEGRVGVGVVPLKDDESGSCVWGCIDVDAHEEDWYVDIPTLQMKVEELGLPLVVCQSKSMGAHCYLYMKEPIPASKLQMVLKEFAVLLQPVTKIRSKTTGQILAQAKVEIFPKQKKLAAGQIGNWVNLPYFNGDTTTRFAYHSGKNLTLAEFLTLAESKRVLPTDLSKVEQTHTEAPPCIQNMLTNGVELGHRNNGLFAIGTYLKKSGADDLEEQLLKVNYDKNIMPKPLGKAEVATIARSIKNGSYHYRCNEEPICNICDKAVCKTRRFGVGEAGPQKAYDNAMFGSLKKILTDPPRWIIEINGVPVELTTEQLMDYKQVRKSMLERVGIVGPPMKAEDWIIILRTKNEQKEEITAPDDAGPGAMIRALLSEFTRSVERAGPDGKPVCGRKEDLLRGLPVVAMHEDEPVVYFRGVDFIAMLKRKRAEEFKGAALWSILRTLGCDHAKIKAGAQAVQVWYKPYQPWNITYEVPKANQEF